MELSAVELLHQRRQERVHEPLLFVVLVSDLSVVENLGLPGQDGGGGGAVDDHRLVLQVDHLPARQVRLLLLRGRGGRRRRRPGGDDGREDLPHAGAGLVDAVRSQSIRGCSLSQARAAAEWRLLLLP